MATKRIADVPPEDLAAYRAKRLEYQRGWRARRKAAEARLRADILDEASHEYDGELYGDGEDQISYDSAMYRD